MSSKVKSWQERARSRRQVLHTTVATAGGALGGTAGAAHQQTPRELSIRRKTRIHDGRSAVFPR
jgi:hypothetical protein